MAAVMIQVISSFFQVLQKTVAKRLQTHMKNTLREKNTVLPTTMTRCFVPYCGYQIKIIEDIKELLQKLDAFCFD